PATEFIKSVRVEGSHDKTAASAFRRDHPLAPNWKELTVGQMIFHMESGVEKLRVDFPEGVWEFLRITIDDTRSKPVPVSSVRAHTARADAPRAAVSVTIKSRDENNGVTRLALDLGAANLTLASLRIETPEPLFTRHVTFAVPEITDDDD